MRITPVGLPARRHQASPLSAPGPALDAYVQGASLPEAARTLFEPVRPLWVHRPALEAGDRPGGPPLLVRGPDVLAATQRTLTRLGGGDGKPGWTVRLQPPDRLREQPPIVLGQDLLGYSVERDHTGRTTGVAVVDVKAGRLLRTVQEESVLASPVPTGDGGFVLGTVGGELVRYGPDGTRSVLATVAGAVAGVAVSREGAVAFRQPGVSAVTVGDREIPLPGSVRTVQAHPQGGFLALSGDALTRLRADGAVEWQRPLLGDYRGLAVAPDGSVFLLEVGGPPELLGLDPQGQARWRRPAEGAREWPDLHVLASGAVALAVPSSGLTAAWRADGSEAWRLQTGGHLTVTPDERLLAVRDGRLQVVDLATGAVPLEFDPQGQRFTWRYGDLQHTVDARGERLEIAGHAASLDGRRLVLPGADGGVSVWEVPPPVRTVDPRPLPRITEGPGWIRIGDVLLPCA